MQHVITVEGRSQNGLYIKKDCDFLQSYEKSL